LDSEKEENTINFSFSPSKFREQSEKKSSGILNKLLKSESDPSNSNASLESIRKAKQNKLLTLEKELNQLRNQSGKVFDVIQRVEAQVDAEFKFPLQDLNKRVAEVKL